MMLIMQQIKNAQSANSGFQGQSNRDGVVGNSLERQYAELIGSKQGEELKKSVNGSIQT
jgi:hypothetical protein